MGEERELTPAVFDRAFANAADSPWLRSVFGADLPHEIEPYSFVTLEALQIIASELRLRHGDTLVDLACGRGGPGLWIAKATGASLIGVDFSRVGVAHAIERAKQFAQGIEVRYIVADAGRTALPGGCADALVCIDAIQLMGHLEAVAAEVARLLREGGRAGFTTWEVESRLPDLTSLLEAAGLAVVSREQRDDWRDREIRIYEHARAEAPTSNDPGLADLAEEADRALPMLADCRRVLVIAQRAAR